MCHTLELAQATCIVLTPAAAALVPSSPPFLPAGSPFNLTDAASVEGLFGRALAELKSGNSGSAPAGVDAQSVQSAAASTVTLVNSLLEQVSDRCSGSGQLLSA